MGRPRICKVCRKKGEVVKSVIGAKPKPALEADFAEWLA